jgi:hypothetical protein
MTVVRKSTMKLRSRYRTAHPKNNKKKSALVVVNGLFLACFTIYQIILSQSNGGREAVASTYRSFLKKGRSTMEGDGIVHYTTEKVIREDDTWLKINADEDEDRDADEKESHRAQNTENHDSNSEQKEVAFGHDRTDVPQEIREHDPFSAENEVKIESDQNHVPQNMIDHDPFSAENEVKVERDKVQIPEAILDHDPFSKENEVTKPIVAVANENKEESFSAETNPGPSYVFDPNHQMFHNYFKGKSGKVVEEMLMAHAYIFHKNATYGGCCGSKSSKILAHKELLNSIGLSGPIRFRCPRDYVQDTGTRRSVVPRDHILAEDTRLWTPEYVDYLRSLVRYPEKRHKEYTIVVHMLRGNTSPCKEKTRGFHSYLPNSHYQSLIDQYMQPRARVIIYTSAKSFEDLNEFRNRGYEVNTDTSLKDTWKDFVTADVFIMSRSDFSLVPAMVAKGIVVYTPFWHHSLRRWKRIGKSIMKQTDEETDLLQDTKCLFPIG